MGMRVCCAVLFASSLAIAAACDQRNVATRTSPVSSDAVGEGGAARPSDAGCVQRPPEAPETERLLCPDCDIGLCPDRAANTEPSPCEISIRSVTESEADELGYDLEAFVDLVEGVRTV